MFWTMAMLLLVGSYVVGGFTPVVLVLATTTVFARTLRVRPVLLPPLTAALKKVP
jgi:hypothetical protein